MGPSPITFQEIDAYQRVTLHRLTAWEVQLIRRLDQVILAVMAKAGETPLESGPVQATHPAGMKAVLQGIAAKKNAQKARKPA